MGPSVVFGIHSQAFFFLLLFLRSRLAFDDDKRRLKVYSTSCETGYLTSLGW